MEETFEKYNYKVVANNKYECVLQNNFVELVIAKDEVSINDGRNTSMCTIPADLVLAIAEKLNCLLKEEMK